MDQDISTDQYLRNSLYKPHHHAGYLPQTIPLAKHKKKTARKRQDQCRHNPKIYHPRPQLKAYAEIQSPLYKFDQFQYLDKHILDKCATLDGPLQGGQPHIVCSDKPSIYKLLMYMVILGLDTLPYQALYDLIHSAESQSQLSSTQNCRKQR